MNTRAEQVIQGLVEIEAISINITEPFIWASGIKAPIYCDNRKSIGHYQLRSQIAQGLSELITKEFPSVDIIGGTATAGIPHATSVADALALPLVYFRSAPKDHGTNSVVEGDFTPGQKIVIVEDLISTGGSVLKCVDYAKASGFEVLGVVSIFNYELKAAVENFSAANIPVFSLAGFSELYKTLALPEEAARFIDTWRQNPQNGQIWEDVASVKA